jgi:hypothetical protein
VWLAGVLVVELLVMKMELAAVVPVVFYRLLDTL